MNAYSHIVAAEPLDSDAEATILRDDVTARR